MSHGGDGKTTPLYATRTLRMYPKKVDFLIFFCAAAAWKIISQVLLLRCGRSVVHLVNTTAWMLLLYVMTVGVSGVFCAWQTNPSLAPAPPAHPASRQRPTTLHSSCIRRVVSFVFTLCFTRNRPKSRDGPSWPFSNRPSADSPQRHCPKVEPRRCKG